MGGVGNLVLLLVLEIMVVGFDCVGVVCGVYCGYVLFGIDWCCVGVVIG